MRFELAGRSSDQTVLLARLVLNREKSLKKHVPAHIT